MDNSQTIHQQLQAVAKKLSAIDGMLARFPSDRKLRASRDKLRLRKVELQSQVGYGRTISL